MSYAGSLRAFTGDTPEVTDIKCELIFICSLLYNQIYMFILLIFVEGWLEMRKTYLVGLLTAMILLSGCVSGPTGTPTPTTTSQTGATAVEIVNYNFVPRNITVPAGTTVTWTNKDSVQHTVTSTSGVFNSGPLNEGQTFSYTFNRTGTYEYECTIHPFIPHGNVIVT